MRLVVLCQLALLVYHQLTTLVDFYPFNGARNYARREKLAECGVNGVLMLLPPVGFAFHISSLRIFWRRVLFRTVRHRTAHLVGAISDDAVGSLAIDLQSPARARYLRLCGRQHIEPLAGRLPSSPPRNHYHSAGPRRTRRSQLGAHDSPGGNTRNRARNDLCIFPPLGNLGLHRADAITPLPSLESADTPSVPDPLPAQSARSPESSGDPPALRHYTRNARSCH